MKISVAELRELIEVLTSCSVSGALASIEGKVNQIMATLAEFQSKIDTINANTTASATAAAAIAQQLADLKTQIGNMGLTADQEAQLFAALDPPITTSSQLKTFLEQTASNPTTEPPPVEPPPTGGGNNPTGTPTEG